jgi:phosphoribosylanthranilate isomerase
MSLWIKICGNTSLADAQLAADAGADAVGFVFAPSPRRVTVEQVAAITADLPESIEKIGVFVEGDADSVADAVIRGGLTGVQLHSTALSGTVRDLRWRFGPDLRILRVVHFGEDAAAQIETLAQEPEIDGVLVDSRTATAVGGTGIAFDWQAARETVFAESQRLRLVAAGGLNAGNVAEAIALLRPWGVDVASGVELSPGRKDAEKVRAFVRLARGADSDTDEELALTFALSQPLAVDDAAFRVKVQEALEDRRAAVPDSEVKAHFAKRRHL